MPTVIVKYFAHLRELAGCDQEHLELASELSVEHIHRAIAVHHPSTAGLLAHTRIAHNQQFVRGQLTLQDNDELALIPPVSGG